MSWVCRFLLQFQLRLGRLALLVLPVLPVLLVRGWVRRLVLLPVPGWGLVPLVRGWVQAWEVWVLDSVRAWAQDWLQALAAGWVRGWVRQGQLLPRLEVRRVRWAE